MPDAPKKKTIEQTYQKKSQLEHILLRPDTYIGSIEKQQEKLWVWDPAGGDKKGEGEMVLRDVEFVPGLYKIFDEILVNAADNKQRCKSLNKIKVDINKSEGYLRVWNNGEGIPVQMHKQHKMYVPELIFGHLLTGSNYDDDEKKTTGGRNGYGAKLANIFSTKFTVETSHKASGKSFKMTWTKNMSKKGDQKIGKSSGEDYCCVTFWPDWAKFKMSGLDKDHIHLLMKRVYDVAGNTPKDVRVYLNGCELPIRDFEHYVDLFPGMGEEKVAASFASPSDRWQICVRPSNIDYQQISFVNSIWTIKGGKHVKYIVDQVIDAVTDRVQKQNKKLEIKPHMVRQFLWVFVNARIENPAFDSQTKETLNTLPAKFGSTCQVPNRMIEALCRVINDRVAMRANDKLDRALAAKVAGAKSGRMVGIPKLEDANDAGTRNSKDCTLILTEGDSAKALVLSGMSEIGRDRYGVFPLRGKLLNCREAPKKQIMENKEIQALIKIIGLKVGHDYTVADVASLRYGRVMIMTDQDTDGSHIKGLLINFVHTFWPGLLKIPGFLVQFITPVVKAFVASKKRVATEGIPFYNIPDMLKFRTDSQKKGIKYDYKYYKGLGSSDNAEAKQYFSDLPHHQLSFVFDNKGGQDDKAIKLGFAKENIEARKAWITAHSADAPGLDYEKARKNGVTYSEFIDKELIWFSVADCERSIPCALDGLKPGQRKALWSSFKRNLLKEIRVAQLTGYVSEKACYHHGESSMQGTIVGLAQDFVGSNNIPLLVPCGQFGSRAMGGKDHASARYIHTKLAPVARALFPKADDYLLNYKDDDGTPVEPEWFIPILPMALINGCSGIGTGFATSIPSYSPTALLQNVRNLLKGHPQKPLMPWYRGHKGKMEALGEGRFVSYGKVQQVDSRVVRITELPVGVWTGHFQQSLDSLQEQGFISGYRNHTTSDEIDIDVGFNARVLEKIVERPQGQGLYEVFNLRSSVPATNIVCFDRRGKLKRFESAEKLLEEWYYVRLEYYSLRKRYLIDDLTKTCEKLKNMVRFIREVNDGKLTVQKRKKAQLLQELKRKNYKPFPPVQKLKLHKASVKEDDVPEEEENDPSSKYFVEKKQEAGSKDEEKATNDYDYLLGMRIWSLTYERAKQLEEQLKKAQEDLDRLKKTSEKSMWGEDLGQLERAVEKADKEWAEHAGKGDGDSGKWKKKGGKILKARLDGNHMKAQNLSESQVKSMAMWLQRVSNKYDNMYRNDRGEDADDAPPKKKEAAFTPEMYAKAVAAQMAEDDVLNFDNDGGGKKGKGKKEKEAPATKERKKNKDDRLADLEADLKVKPTKGSKGKRGKKKGTDEDDDDDDDDDDEDEESGSGSGSGSGDDDDDDDGDDDSDDDEKPAKKSRGAKSGKAKKGSKGKKAAGKRKRKSSKAKSKSGKKKARKGSAKKGKSGKKKKGSAKKGKSPKASKKGDDDLDF